MPSQIITGLGLAENNRCEGNDHQYGFYTGEWSGSSEDTEFVLSGKEVRN